jgi:glycosyltransferase involved in cell wall biosynthesis
MRCLKDAEDTYIKILHCLSQLPAKTGSGIYYQNVVRRLKRQTDWEQAALFAVPAGRNIDVFGADAVYPVHFGTATLPFPIAGMSDEMPYPSTPYHTLSEEQLDVWRLSFRTALLRAKDEFRPDIIICHHLWMLCRLVLEIFIDIPVIAVAHGTDIRQAIQHPDMCSREVGPLNSLSKVLALSHRQVDEINRCFGIDHDKIIVTGGAIDTSLFYPPKPLRARGEGEAVRFIYAGKLAESKGTFELIEAFFAARKEDASLTLDLVGNAPFALTAGIRELFGDFPAVRCYDTETQAQFARHLRKSDVFVFPSYYEGLGFVALEALASGLFLVSNRLSALIEMLGPQLSSDPAISWVNMPDLEGIDRIKEKEKPAYIEALKDAILFQAKRRRDDLAVKNQPHRALTAFSWAALTDRICPLISSLVSVQTATTNGPE